VAERVDETARTRRGYEGSSMKRLLSRLLALLIGAALPVVGGCPWKDIIPDPVVYYRPPSAM